MSQDEPSSIRSGTSFARPEGQALDVPQQEQLVNPTRTPSREFMPPAGGPQCIDSPSSPPPRTPHSSPSLPRSSQASSYVARSIGHSLRSNFASKLRAAESNATVLKHRRDEIVENPDFQWKTFNPSDDYYFDDAYRSLEQPDSVNTLECWDYDDTDGVDRNEYVRFLEAGDVRHFGPDDNNEPSQFHERFEKWLKREGDFIPLRPDSAGALNGGLRLALCDRPLMNHGMTIRKEMFEAIEKEFELHDATLPAFTDDGGCFSMFTQRRHDGQLHKVKIVVKAVQKVEITNCLISLSHDITHHWTDAFVCGDSLILGQDSDETYGNQGVQVMDACACVGKYLWRSPLLLPVALLQMCTRRALIRAKTLEKRLHGVERALGVVNAGWVLIKERRPNWPMDIDIRRQTTELHSTLPQILFLKGVVQWQKRYAAWLLETAKDLQAETMFADQRDAFEELRSTIQIMASSIDGMLEFFEGMEGRTQSQINLLFSVVGQKDANLNLKIAHSTKADSISMSTFTFITALFLPGSFIATMFSMGMFSWTADSADSDDIRVLSKRYWIFWAVVLPLTLLVLGGWYLWYDHAYRGWQRKLELDDAKEEVSQEEKERRNLREKQKQVIAEHRRANMTRAEKMRDSLARMRPEGLVAWARSQRPGKREKAIDV